MGMEWMKLVSRNTCIMCLFLALVGVMNAEAQPPNSFTTVWNNAGTSNWTTTTNWSGGTVPDVNFEDAALINNGGTAFISSVVAQQAGGVVLGAAAGDTGSLEIRNGGNLTVVASGSFPADGSMRVGQGVMASGGTGHLSVLPGGTLSSVSLSLAGAAGSTLSLGGTAAGTTTVNTGPVSIFRAVQVTGPNVNFNSSAMTITDTATLLPVITGATHSPLKSTGTATIAGTLRPQFVSTTPMPGQRWNIIDAAVINGAMNLDLSLAPALGVDQTYIMATVPGGNGSRLQFGVEQLLRLTVNWDTKAISITNSGTTDVTIDGYSVLSAFGSLNPAHGVWNSLADQSVSGWQEAGPTVNALSELNPNGSLTIAGGQTRTLGTPFNPTIPSEFGVSPEDIVFQYGKPTNEKFTGVVEYLGTRDTNNFRLTVDPATGQAQLRNDGGIPIALEGYSIFSNSGALLTTWNSLDDQNVGGATVWQEAGASTTALSELNPLSSTVIAPNAGFAVGTLWNTGGARDLRLVFQLENESEERNGAVVFGTLPALGGGLAGDFNNDGIVDAADYTVWRNHLNEPTEANINNNGDGGGITSSDYTFWKARYGNTSPGSGGGGVQLLSTVPEPTSQWLAFIGVFGIFLLNRTSFVTFVDWCLHVTRRSNRAAFVANQCVVRPSHLQRVNR